jgi:Na+/H+-translocating membrane pyrophosphatase
LAIFGISGLFLAISAHYANNSHLTQTNPPIEDIPLILVGFGFGASFVAMFA